MKRQHLYVFGLLLIVAMTLTHASPVVATLPRADVADKMLIWDILLGGEGHAIATDKGGNIYVTGHSDYAWGTGECANCPIRPYTGNWDVFVAKLNSSGTLTWLTFLGESTGDDQSFGMAVDESGDVYVKEVAVPPGVRRCAPTQTSATHSSPSCPATAT
jgi:hypothetical protein